MTRGPWLKVCGLADRVEVASARDGGATHVGLWWSMGESAHALGMAALAKTSGHARSAGMRPVLVTLSGDPEQILRACREGEIDAVQLHAFQPPRTVAAVRQGLPAEGTVVKVIHAEPDGTSPDLRLVSAYRAAGVDAFLLDTMDGGRVGSTGRALSPATVRAIVPRFEAPFILAGGLTATPAPEQLDLRSLPGFAGVDVDSAARGDDGRPDASRIRRLHDAWLADGPPTALPHIPILQGGHP